MRRVQQKETNLPEQVEISSTKEEAKKKKVNREIEKKEEPEISQPRSEEVDAPFVEDLVSEEEEVKTGESRGTFKDCGCGGTSGLYFLAWGVYVGQCTYRYTTDKKVPRNTDPFIFTLKINLPMLRTESH